MNRAEILARIQANVERLSAPDLPEYKYIPLHQKPSPSVETLAEVMRLLRTVLFPGFFGAEQEARLGSIQYYTGVYLERIYDLLQEQIYNGLCFEAADSCSDPRERSSEVAIDFIARIGFETDALARHDHLHAGLGHEYDVVVDSLDYVHVTPPSLGVAVPLVDRYEKTQARLKAVPGSCRRFRNKSQLLFN